MRFSTIAVALSLWSVTVAAAVEPFTLAWKNHPIPGTEYHSIDHPDAIFVIHHWMHGCGWCHEHEPKVIQLAKDYMNEERVQVLDTGIATSQQGFDDWITKHMPPYPVLDDKGRVLARMLGIKVVSTTSIVDCNGKIRYQKEGYWNAQEQGEIRDLIDGLLKEPCN